MSQLISRDGILSPKCVHVLSSGLKDTLSGALKNPQDRGDSGIVGAGLQITHH